MTTGARAQVLADAREFLRAWAPPRAARGAGGAPSGGAAGGAAPGLPRVDFDFACSKVELLYGGGAEARGGAGLAPLACVSFEGAVLRSERAGDTAGSDAGGGGGGSGGEVFSGELRALQLALCSCAAPRGPAAGELAAGPRLQREAELLVAPVAIAFAGRAAAAPGDPAGLERASFWLRASVPQARVREPAPPPGPLSAPTSKVDFTFQSRLQTAHCRRARLRHCSRARIWGVDQWPLRLTCLAAAGGAVRRRAGPRRARRGRARRRRRCGGTRRR
jgi:hypothetical protein